MPKLDSFEPAERDDARELAEKLLGAFAWELTSDGDQFWSDVYDKLMDIAAGRS